MSPRTDAIFDPQKMLVRLRWGAYSTRPDPLAGSMEGRGELGRV